MLCCIEYLYFPKVRKYQLETGQKEQLLNKVESIVYEIMSVL